eukprot:scaffold57576_cov48-Phaeocystis_antarctica.AAC.1
MDGGGFALLPQGRQHVIGHTGRHELDRPRLCCRADAVQHAESGQPFEKRGAVDLGEHGLLLGRALVALEFADGRVVVVVHRVAEEHRSCGVALVSGRWPAR